MKRTKNAETELTFAVDWLIDAHLDLKDCIAHAQRDGISAQGAATAHRRLVELSQQTCDAVTAVARILNEAQMEKLV